MDRRLLIVCAALAGVGQVPAVVAAQDTVYFSTTAAGVTKSIDTWGLDTAWPSTDNMRQGIEHMGLDQVDVVRVNFYVDEPLLGDGTLGPSTKSRLDNQLSIAAMASGKPIALTPNSGDATDSWYLNGSEVRVDRWSQVIKATQQYIAQQGMTVVEVEPFNEPDYWAGQGTPQNLKSVMETLKADPAFSGVAMVGASTLNSDNAAGWYNTIAGPADYGSTHQLAGATDSYINFIQQVAANGDTPYNPEIHSIGEVLYGAEYGLEGGIWWGPAFLARGLVVNSVQGSRLGYAENRGAGTAAAVYRDPNGNLHAFAGGFERDYQGVSTSYRIVSTDRDMYFNGVGPIREYMALAAQNDQGALVDIQDESEALPALDGHRWQIVNRQTGQVLEVADGSVLDGADVRTAADAGALNQRWDIVRELDGYYTLSAAHSGKTAEIADWSLDNGANARQWGTGDNILQHWYLEKADDGYYYIHNGHSNKLLTSSVGAAYQSGFVRNRATQQWEFVAASPAPSSSVVAHYEFESNGLDSAGTNHAVLSGGPSFVSGPSGLAINFDGSNDYATLPAGIADADGITVAAWVRWDGGADWQRIFDFGNDTTANMFLTPRSGDGTMRFAITTEGGDGEQLLDTDPLPVGEWVHLTLTLGGNTGVLYVNGLPRVAGQILLDPSDFNPVHNYLGKSQYADALLDGQIDDFRIYGFALDAAQVANLVRPGDYNGDGVVDAADYTVWRDTLGSTTDLRANGDDTGTSAGVVDEADYAVWRAHFGETVGGGASTLAAATVPEPAGVVMWLLGLGAMLAGRGAPRR